MRQVGFTLLELLIALAIFSLMSVMAYGGLAAVIQTRESVNQAMDRLSQVQKAIYRLQNDIEAAQPRPIRNQFGEEEAAVRQNIDGEGLYLTRGGWRNPLSMPRSSLQRVYYRLEDKQLIRRSWPILDGLEVDARPDDPNSVTREDILLEQVEEIRWRFLQDGVAEGQDFEDLEWLEQWPPFSDEPDPTALPRAIEILITSEEWGEIRYLFRLGPGMPLNPIAADGGGEGDQDGGDDNDEDDESKDANDNDNDNGTDPGGGGGGGGVDDGGFGDEDDFFNEEGL